MGNIRTFNKHWILGMIKLLHYHYVPDNPCCFLFFFLNIQNEIEVDVEPSLIFDLFKMNRKVFQFLNSGSDMAGTPTLDRFKV